MNCPYEDTGNRILKLRKKYGLTREQLAEMSDIWTRKVVSTNIHRRDVKKFIKI